jgi:DNA repair ATPase RecN
LLAHLQIRDFAIIDSAELELSAGLTALTGETGAGKSIIDAGWTSSPSRRRTARSSCAASSAATAARAST